jgi:hypothetical protein
MGTVSWNVHGCKRVDFLPRKETVNAVRCVQTLQKLRRALHDKRPIKRRIILQHDNARPHTAHLTSEKTEKFGWEMLPNFHSLGFSSADCHLFRPLRDYENDEAV